MRPSRAVQACYDELEGKVSAVEQLYSKIEAPIAFEFVVPGDCVPWARAGGGKTMHRFIPDKQAKYMAAMKLICQAAMKGVKPLDCPIALTIFATYQRPRSWSAKKRANARWHVSRPDWDNLAKIVGDALNGVAWVDDAQIACARVEKFYGDFPGLRVKITLLT